MRKKQGGLCKWCPSCKRLTVCKASDPSSLAGKSGQRWQYTDHKDINWFRRALKCQSCYHKFLTAEVDEGFLGELVTLRHRLKAIKFDAEAYVEQAADASTALAKLTESLGKLRALSEYRAA